LATLAIAGLVLPAGPSAAPSDADAAIERRVERGPVTATVRLAPKTVMIGDTVTLEIAVESEPGVEVLMPEFGAHLGRFAIVDFVPRSTSPSDDKGGRARTGQRYRLYSPLSGTRTIPALSIEFIDHRPGHRPAPEGEHAYEILTPRISFEIEPAAASGAGTKLSPLPEPLAPLPDRAAARRRSWAIGATGLAVAALAMIVLWRRRRPARTPDAWASAHHRLETLRTTPYPRTDDLAALDAFFVELSALVREYLERRFGLHAPEFTTEEFLEVATRSPDLTGSDRGFLESFLGAADQVKFAHDTAPAQRITESLDAVGAFLHRTREPAPFSRRSRHRTASTGKPRRGTGAGSGRTGTGGESDAA